jgi:hypothetical protein
MARREHDRVSPCWDGPRPRLDLLSVRSPQDDFFPDRMRLQDDFEPFPVIVRESGSDVEPVIILLRAREDRLARYICLASSAMMHLPFV